MKEPTFEELKEKYFGKLVRVSYMVNGGIGIVVALEQSNAGFYRVRTLFKNKMHTMSTYHFTNLELVEDIEEGDDGNEVL